MVSTRTAPSRRGASTLGCLVSLLVFAAVVYYGVNLGRVWLRYNELSAEMRSAARLAPGLNDATIRRRLVDKCDELDLPEPARKFSIRRSVRPSVIIIETHYDERVQLLLFDHTFHLAPRAEAPL